MLVLPIKKKWFDMIKSGEKKEEYREIKPYWTKRFCHALYDLELGNSSKTLYKGQGTVIFQNGYQKNAPKIKCEMLGITHSQATDIRKKDYACKLYKEK